MAPVFEQAPHVFPAWPLNYLSFYRHLAEDYGRCIRALGQATDPVQAARAEGDYGVWVMHDLMQAWYDLALAPYSAMVKAASEASPSVGAEPASSDLDPPAVA